MFSAGFSALKRPKCIAIRHERTAHDVSFYDSSCVGIVWY